MNFPTLNIGKFYNITKNGEKRQAMLEWLDLEKAQFWVNGETILVNLEDLNSGKVNIEPIS